jgi:hypothetical protein
MKPLCIYHGCCADGFTAAWVVWKFYGEGQMDFHAATPNRVIISVTLVDN